MMDEQLMASEAQIQRSYNDAQNAMMNRLMRNMQNAATPPLQYAGPYESPSLNKKLAAAKQWLAERR